MMNPGTDSSITSTGSQRIEYAKKRITSPRCVMASDLSSPLSIRSSPVTIVQEQSNQRTVRKVKILVLQGNFKEALQIGNEYLQQQIRDGWTGPLSYFQTTFSLYAPLTMPEMEKSAKIPSKAAVAAGASISYSFQVRLGTQLTVVDEITTIVLQCWYELAKKDSNNNNKTRAWRHLLPLLEMYSRHPMPLQFVVEFWIPFWHSFPWMDSTANYLAARQVALAWSLQVALFVMEYSHRMEAIPRLVEELRDQLVVFLVTQQLVLVSSPTLATQLLKMVFLQEPLPTQEEWKQFFLVPLNNCVDDTTLHALRQVLQDISDTTTGSSTTTGTSTTTSTISKALSEKILQHDKFQNLPVFDGRTQQQQSSSSMIPQWNSNSFLSSKWIHFLYGKWQSILQRWPIEFQSRFWNQWCQSVLAVVSSGATPLPDHPDSKSTSLQQYKGQVALSILGLLVAWRWKGYLKQWGRACSMAILAPFIELVDALVPPQTRKDK